MKQHNPDNLTPAQIALIPGLRLLDEDEIIEAAPSRQIHKVSCWCGKDGWMPGYCGMSAGSTYGTTATRAELRIIRGLPPEPAAESATPRTDGEFDALIERIDNGFPAPFTLKEAVKWMADVARSLETELRSIRGLLPDSLIHCPAPEPDAGLIQGDRGSEQPVPPEPPLTEGEQKYADAQTAKHLSAEEFPDKFFPDIGPGLRSAFRMGARAGIDHERKTARTEIERLTKERDKLRAQVEQTKPQS